MIAQIDEKVLRDYFARLDALVSPGTVLYVFGGGAVALLGAAIRTTIDIDIAAPYSKVAESEFRAASEKAGLPVNPGLGYQGAYVEFVPPLTLAMPRARTPDDEIVLFSGLNLTVKTGSVADLIASKLIRYNDKDRSDVQYLADLGGIVMDDVVASVERLPERIKRDVVLRANLENLSVDLSLWKEAK